MTLRDGIFVIVGRETVNPCRAGPSHSQIELFGAREKSRSGCSNSFESLLPPVSSCSSSMAACRLLGVAACRLYIAGLQEGFCVFPHVRYRMGFVRSSGVWLPQG